MPHSKSMPQNSRSRACGKSGPAEWTCGRIFRRSMERTAFRGSCQILPHAGALAAAGTRPAPDSGAVDRTKATCSSAVPASGQDSWAPPSTQFDRLGTTMPCLVSAGQLACRASRSLSRSARMEAPQRRLGSSRTRASNSASTLLRRRSMRRNRPSRTRQPTASHRATGVAIIKMVHAAAANRARTIFVAMFAQPCLRMLCRARMAWARVYSSVYLRSMPMGIPQARRLAVTPSLSSSPAR